MIINNINDNGPGPWGGGNNQNPWGKRPNSNGTPPDVDQMLNESKDKIKKMSDCGITVANSPSKIGKTLFDKLSN